MIFSTTQQLYDASGGACSVNLHLPGVEGSYRSAYRQYVRDYIPDAVLTATEAAISAGSPTTEQTALLAALPYLRRTLAHFTLYKYSLVGDVNLTNEGMRRITSDQSDSAYKYQVTAYRTEQLAAGYEALEECLEYLQAHRTAIPIWHSSTGATYYRRTLLRSSSTFRQAHHYRLSRHTFEHLLGIVSEVEAYAIVPLLGAEFFGALKTLLDESTPPTTDPLREVLARVHKATAAFAVQEALIRNTVQLQGDTVQQVEALEPQSYLKSSPPAVSTTSLAVLAQQDFANRHIAHIREYLQANQDNEDLATWLDYETTRLAAITAAQEAAAAAAAAAATDASTASFSTGYRTAGTPTKVVAL